MQLVRALDAQPRSHALRMNARAEERFIRIDVSNTAHESLIQQQSFYTGAAPLQRGREIVHANFERLRPQSRHARGKFMGEFNAAELAAIVKKQRAAVERKDGMRVLARRSAQQQT